VKSITKQLLKAIMETEKHLKKEHRHERVSTTHHANSRWKMPDISSNPRMVHRTFYGGQGWD